MMKRDLALFMALSRYSEINSKKIKVLIDKKYDNIENFIAAPSEELWQFFKKKEIILKIRALSQDNHPDVSKNDYIIDICKDRKIKIITILDSDYPEMFTRLSSPPKILFVKGAILPKDMKSFSIIGTRNPTHYGHSKAREIAYDLASENFTIISGLARGIDTQAHIGALDAGGRTIAVIGSGISSIYPPENEELASDIANKGAIISESFPDERVRKWTLQKRNELNCGLSCGSIFIEGTKKSGTHWQIKFALKQNKPLFALRPKDFARDTSYIPQYIINNFKGYEIQNAQDVLAIFKRIGEKNNSNLLDFGIVKA
ncbi:MAG: DNA-processing protein DprA [Candidatus Lokiarchaeota archaeon]|nr:DNA-processing protein DprA [Candidatus Lokiarchaeota archaeon]